MRSFRRILVSVLLVVAATAAGRLFADFSLTSTVMLYLLAVTVASYFLGLSAAVFAAIASFLAINYFFIEPRYTFEVANAESWVVLFSFLVVSAVVASLVRRLQNQTLRAELARKRAEFARELSEQLAAARIEEQVLREGCRLIHEAARQPAGIAVPDAHGEAFILTQQFPSNSVTLNQRAARWCCRNARMIGPGSGNWPELDMWLFPFERLPGVFPVLVVMNKQGAVEEGEITYLRGLLDQLAMAYQRVRNEKRAKDAEVQAQKESVQNALLASVSHDMRTPLTAILGASTTLLEQRDKLGEDEQLHLLRSVSTEAQHLADTTNNILALSRLELSNEHRLTLDWQSPEEIVGTVLQRYRHRALQHGLRSEVPGSSVLIKADAALLAQALGNLIDNALLAHHGTEPILIGMEERGETVALYVKDRGAGFPEYFHVEHIRKFQRFNPQGKGMGLGLYIVQTIAQLHGAKLQITRREGGGACVALIFPAKQMGGNIE
jgi:two-component system sensor histidine kinase KdpD